MNAIKGNVVKADEIKQYFDYRYVYASEAVWHIFKFDMHERFPAIECLQYHLPNQQMVYDQHSLTIDVDDADDRFNDDQLSAYETILNVVTNKDGKLFSVYGNGGIGKTFVWRMLLSLVRGQGKIMLIVASSGIASLLLLGGKTTHSKFKISIDLHDESTCNITQ
jgi:hypothetical protein